MAKAPALTADNVASYAETKVIPALGLGPAVVTSVTEVSAHTYVNWIFHLVLRTRDGELSVYLRQGRDYTKARPAVRIDPGRLAIEVRVLELIGAIVPGATPTVLWHDRDANVIVLDDIRQGAPLLVDELRIGRTHGASAARFGRTVGRIHAATRAVGHEQVHGSAEANETARRVAEELRVAPARSTHPDAVEGLLREGADRGEGLVLGDLGSKNVIAAADGFRFLDLERAFVGDQAFDLGFLFAHYLVEVPAAARGAALDAIAAFLAGYSTEQRRPEDGGVSFDDRVVRWLGVMILYRTSDAYMGRRVDDDAVMWRDLAAQLLRSERGEVVGVLRRVMPRPA